MKLLACPGRYLQARHDPRNVMRAEPFDKMAQPRMPPTVKSKRRFEMKTRERPAGPGELVVIES